MEPNNYHLLEPVLEPVLEPAPGQISAEYNPFSSPHVCGAETCEGWFNATVGEYSLHRFVHIYVDWSNYGFERVVRSARRQIKNIKPTRYNGTLIIPVIHRTGGDTIRSKMAPIVRAIEDYCRNGNYGFIYMFMTCNANCSAAWAIDGTSMVWFNCEKPIDGSFYHVQRLFTGTDPEYAKDHIDDYIKVLAQNNPELYAQADFKRSAYGTNLEKAGISYCILPPGEMDQDNAIGIKAD